MASKSIIELLTTMRFGHDPEAVSRLRLDLTRFASRTGNRISRSAINNWISGGVPSRREAIAFLFDYYKEVVANPALVADPLPLPLIDDYFTENNIHLGSPRKDYERDLLSWKRATPGRELADFLWSEYEERSLQFVMYRPSTNGRKLAKGIIDCKWNDREQQIEFQAYWKPVLPWDSLSKVTGAVFQDQNRYLFVGRQDEGALETISIDYAEIAENRGILPGLIMFTRGHTTFNARIVLVEVRPSSSFRIESAVRALEPSELRSDLQVNGYLLNQSWRRPTAPSPADVSTLLSDYILSTLGMYTEDDERPLGDIFPRTSSVMD